MSRQISTNTPKPESSTRIPKAPERPLPPYMRFSKKMWPGVRIENPNFQLWEISKKVGQLWADLSDSEKSIYHDEFESEKVEFEKQMRNYQQSHGQYLSVKTKSVKNLIDKGLSYGGGTSRKGGSSDQNSLSGIVIQPVDDEDPCEMTQQKLSAIRYDRNNRLMLELFSSNYLCDQRSMIHQHRIEHLRRQSTSLEQHQNKLNEELARLEESFNQRKKTIINSNETFNDALKKVCDEKPQFDQESYEKKVAEYQDQFLKIHEGYKKRLQMKLEDERKETPVLSSLINGTPGPSTIAECSRKTASERNELPQTE